MRVTSDPLTLPIIAISFDSKATAALMDDVLDQDYGLIHGLGQLGDRKPDLIIADATSLQRHYDQIRERRAHEEPVVLPVLLIADNHAAGHSSLTAELGKTTDDILRLPSTRREVLARIGNLLRIRQLSLKQEATGYELAGVVGALRALNSCDDVLAQAKTESDMLQAFCNNIVAGDTYSLAWVSFVPGAEQTARTVDAVAGDDGSISDTLATDWHDYANSHPQARGDGHDLVVIERIADNLNTLPRHPLALQQGLVSAFLLHLHVNIGASGYLVVYSSQESGFGLEERQLLMRLATNLCHALNSLRFKADKEVQNAQINSMAYTDPLTGLANRCYLVRHMDQMLAATEPHVSHTAAILFVDLDGFKPINDVFGRVAGDQVLVQVAQRLQHSVRDTDLVIRQGGDEFLVVLFDAPRVPRKKPAIDGEAFHKLAMKLAWRIIHNLKAPMIIAGQEHQLSASIGIGLCPDHGKDTNSVIQAADNAMYEAKKSGGGCQLYSPEMLEKRQQRMTLERALRRAIEQDQLCLHYQPIFSLDNLRITGVEALARWPQKDGSMIMPDRFIALAEETGLIRPLGDWVLQTAARQLAQWHEAGHPIRMAVNLSIHQLHPEGCAMALAARVQPFIDPCWITLEITESLLMVEPEAISAILHQLRDLGFQIAIDDFGTGYSSLSRLQHLPLHILKIDRSFVTQMTRGGKGAVMIPIIQQMATSFSLQTVAEGIETETEYLQLRQAGVELGQGYWFSRPVPPEQLQPLLLRPAQTTAVPHL